MPRQILRGWIVLIAVVAAGCSGFSLGPRGGLFDGLSSRPNPRRPGGGRQASRRIDSSRPSGADTTSTLAMARLAERRDRPEPAERIYKAILQKDPKNAEAYHRLAVISSKAGRFKEADGYFAKVLKLRPSDPAVLCDLGYSYYLQQRLDEAEAVLDQALALEPNDAAISNNLALLYGDQGRYADCLAMFQRTCSDAKAYANLAFVYAQHGELDRAKAMYNRALSIDNRLRPAAEAMVQLAKAEAQVNELGETRAAAEPDGPEKRAEPAGAPPVKSNPAMPPTRDPLVGRAGFQPEQPGEKTADLILP